jgi:hypothetical protein
VAAAKDILLKRFAELDEDLVALKKAADPSGYLEPPGHWSMWIASAIDLASRILPAGSVYLERLTRAGEASIPSTNHLDTAGGVFRAAKRDFEAGYLFDLEVLASGEVLGDFVQLAKMALAEDKVSVAAVLASAALEDALKRYALSNGVNEAVGKDMQQIINLLKSKGLVAGAQKTLLDTMPKIRDRAMHADWGKLSAVEVSGLIGCVEQFIQQHFSGNSA